MATVTDQAWRSHYSSMKSHLLQSRQHYFLAVEFGTGDEETILYSSIGCNKSWILLVLDIRKITLL